MSKPMCYGRDPRVDIILAQLHDGELSRDNALKALLQIGLSQFSEDFENGDSRETRQANTQQRKAQSR